MRCQEKVSSLSVLGLAACGGLFGRASSLRRVGLAVCAALVAVLALGQSVRGEIMITTVGSPTFEVVDAHLFTAPTDPASFRALFPDHFPTRVQHGPPYTQEYSSGLALTGYPQGNVFSVAQFTAPNAVHLGYTIVPNTAAPLGSSFDFSNNAILPNNLFPITAQGDVYRNGVPYELGAFGLSLPGDANFDGRSHFLLDHWENSDFAPPGLASLIGDYEYRLAIRDVNNNGFDVVAQFQLTPVPEPAALAQFALCSAVVAGAWVWRYRRRA